MTPTQLQASYWTKTVQAGKDQDRLQLAANAPGHSVHAASNDNGTSVVMAIQSALLMIPDYSGQLTPPIDLSGTWGPYPIDQGELDNKTFGTTTIIAVKLFQKQNQIDQDGKVGRHTFNCLDSLMLQVAEASSGSGGDGGGGDASSS
jgi:hypothetical protein